MNHFSEILTINGETDAVEAEIAALQGTLDGLVNDLAALKLVTAAKERTITEINAKIADQDVEIETTNDEIDTKKTDKTDREQELTGKL